MTLTGANVPLAKAIGAHVPIYAFLVFRFALSTAALAILARWEPGPRLHTMSRIQMRDVVAMSLFGMVGYTVLIFEGVRRTSASDAGIIAATLPAVVALLSVLLLADRLHARQWAAVALAVAGLLMLQTGSGGGESSLAGNALVGGAVLCEAAFVIVGKRLAPPFRPLRLALGANAAGLALSLPLLLVDAGALARVAELSSWVWLQCVWYVLSASVLCLWLWYRGLPYLPTWLAGLATAALPVSALVFSALFLHEAIGPAKLLGAALVIVSIVLGAAAARRSG